MSNLLWSAARAVPVWVYLLVAGGLYLHFAPIGSAHEKARQARIKALKDGPRQASPMRIVSRRPSVARSSSSSTLTGGVTVAHDQQAQRRSTAYQPAYRASYAPSPRSSSLRHEYTPVLSPAPPAQQHKRHFDDDGDSLRKRVKQDDTDYSEEDSDVPMELDEVASTSFEGQRGLKREASEELRSAKRNRQDERATKPSPRKRRQASSDENEEAVAGRKKRTKTRITKRDIEDVSSSDESEGEEERRPRNADSEAETDEEEPEPPRQFRSRRETKRARSTSTRASSEDDDLMSGTLDGMESPAPESKAPSPKKRVLPKQRTVASPVRPATKRSTPATKPGSRWTDLEGDEYKIDEQGVKRRRCEIRETRKKYKLPADSKHPDRFATHEVLVEKWLTDEEYASAVKLGILGWQDSGEQDTSNMSVDSSTSSYFGTPLRRAFSLSRPSSQPRHSGPPTPASGSPFSSSGRLRLASGASPRVMSTSRSLRLLDEERKLSEEKERRRTASISFGASDESEEAPLKVNGTESPAVKTVDTNRQEEKPSSTAAPAFSFDAAKPAASAEQATAKKPDFSFAPSQPASTAALQHPSKPAFSFAPAAAPPEKKETGAPAFSFGTSNATAAAAPQPAPAPKPAFSFGTASSAPALAAPSTSSAGFSFGNAPSAPSASMPESASAPAASKPAFSFGTNTSASSPSLFGASAAPAPTAVPSPFGGAPATASTASTPSSLFGAASTSTPSFGSTAAPSSTPAFSFGTTSSTPAAPSQGMGMGTGGFSFGSSGNGGTSAAPGTGLPGMGAAPAFNLGAGGATTPGGGRRIRRLPSSRN